MKTSSDGNLIGPPYPFLPPGLSALPTFLVTNNIFIVDDTGGQLMPSSAGRMSSAQAASTMQAQAKTMAALIGRILYPAADEEFQPNGFTPMFDTSGLWLEASNEDNYYLGLRAHNTIGGDNYQLLSTTNLLNHSWDLGQILFGASDGYADFSPVPMTNAMTFFRAHHANPVMYIWNYQDSEELNPTNTSDPGQIGIIYIQNEGWATNDVTVYYAIGGTAQNGVDYSNLTGVATFSNSQGYAEIDIDPIADGLKPNQTVILTLMQNTNYLIDPSMLSATNILKANPQVYPIINGDNERVCPNTRSPIDLSSDASAPNDLPRTYSILTWPTHGRLDTNGIPTVAYTSTNCYEGQDSFTFQVNNGQYGSTGTVTLIIADPVYAYLVSPQTCRGGSANFSLGSDNCGETLSYSLLSSPVHGTLSGTAANLTYTATGTNFTGVDSFNYILYSGCGGDSATGTVTVTIGDEYLNATPQTLITGTNRPVAIILSAADNSDACIADTNYYTYTIVSGSGPTHGTLTGTPPNLTYKPNTNYEGMDSFQFTVKDGVWSNSATVTIDVTAGPILFRDCNPFGAAVKLAWMLDTNEQVMFPNPASQISDFIVYRSAVSGSNYTAIATNYYTGDTSWMTYLDTNAVVGQTNYYVVTFQAADSPSGVIVESPLSNKIKASGQNLNPLIPADAIWSVVTNLDNPSSVTNLQAPFSSEFTNQYPRLYPLPHTFWPVGTTWSNHITMFIPSNSVPLAQVTYSIAIDNNYQLYLNNSNAPIESFNHEGNATWAPFKAFEDVAPGLLHYGTNNIGVVIVDKGYINYFSMIVSTNTCGW